MTTVHTCPRCKKVLATEDLDALPGQEFQVTPGTIMTAPPGQAPRLKCPCGMVVIVLHAGL